MVEQVAAVLPAVVVLVLADRVRLVDQTGSPHPVHGSSHQTQQRLAAPPLESSHLDQRAVVAAWPCFLLLMSLSSFSYSAMFSNKSAISRASCARACE